MKHTLKALAACLMLLSLLCMLSACSGGISRDEAEAHITGFLKQIKAGDYAAAQASLHPDRPATLDVWFTAVANDLNVDWTTLEEQDFTFVSSAAYDSTVDGAAYAMNVTALVSGRRAEMAIELVRNDQGFGIYNLTLDIP